MNKTQLLNISRTSSVFPSVIIDSIPRKKLGFIFYVNLNFSIMVAKACKSTNYQLYKKNL